MKRIGRRGFIKYSGGVMGLLLLGKYARLPFPLRSTEGTGTEEPTQKTAEPAVDGWGTVVDQRNKFVMVIDVGACIGCRRCQWACKEENNIPDTISPPWIEVFELNVGGNVTGHPSPQDLKEGAY